LSKIAFSPNASGTGTFTVAAPNTNTDYTLTLPQTTGTLALTTQAITQTTGSAPYYGARAWVNFNGTGTVAIRASVNVTSITDNGTGDYTVNFTTAMPDADYAFSVGCATSANNIGLFAAEAFGDPSYTSSGRLAGSFRVTTKAAARLDTDLVSVAVFR
jgi:hypothetical protein